MPHTPQPQLRVQLLGDFELSLNGQPLTAADKPRLQSLLAYLALHSGKVQRRSHLAIVFWPDSEEKQALANLQSLLHGLKQALPQIDSILHTETQYLTWKADASCSIDVQKLRNALEKANIALHNSNKSQARHNLEQAVLIYRGELLPKLYEEWIEPMREQLRVDMSKALAQLIEILKDSRQYAEAIHYSKIWIHANRLSESSHYALIELHTLNSDRVAALLAYKTFRSILKRELGITPSDALQKLHRRIISETPEVIQASPPLTLRTTVPTKRPQLEKPKPVLLSILAAGLVAIVLFLNRSNNNATHTPPPEKSIAILPFENLSNLYEDIFFTDGFHNDLITQISHIRDVQMVSCTSVMEYRGASRNLQEIAKELGVANIIEGGVQRVGDQIRINVQLIDASTGFHLWSEKYTRRMTTENIFAIQSEVIEAVVAELKAIFTVDEK